ncbi:MAG: hypothetical protein JWN32_3203 [Solirubrobacterales bacterium]|jgi:hypothetical protein|nr:hypothetical protein [Solirubrobacterales bacterium]
MEHDPHEEEETRAAAAGAGRIGGVAGDEDIDPAQRPLAEAGEGESEGFELAEDDLIDHASHGDQHAASRAAQDASHLHEDPRAESDGGEADHEETSEDTPGA